MGISEKWNASTLYKTWVADWIFYGDIRYIKNAKCVRERKKTLVNESYEFANNLDWCQFWDNVKEYLS